MVRLAVAAIAILIIGAASGCGVKGQVRELQAQVVELQNAQKSQAGQLAQAQQALDKSQAQAKAMAQQNESLRADVTALQAQTKNNSLVAQSPEALIKNLENFRDIYKAQYEALDNILARVKGANGGPN
jgi:chromosome segregation ATPase